MPDEPNDPLAQTGLLLRKLPPTYLPLPSGRLQITSAGELFIPLLPQETTPLNSLRLIFSLPFFTLDPPLSLSLTHSRSLTLSRSQA
ncbi:unnamed protein product [Protopolystoma xenopodis]|uniref:Uncharacterized protein n=1 Tax=Protopolystoma xenopodis TaxID=117903 RepID=A0A3S5BNR2_9PLAT|nr:unnamed protein product [Protopolystoma xenopodis]